MKVTSADGSSIDWRIKSCPWWLDARRDGDSLILRPRNCGRYSGEVRISARRQKLAISVTFEVSPSRLARLKGVGLALIGTWFGQGLGGLLLGIYSFYAEDAFPPQPHLEFGPIGSLATGFGIGLAFGALVGGRRAALRSGVGAMVGNSLWPYPSLYLVSPIFKIAPPTVRGYPGWMVAMMFLLMFAFAGLAAGLSWGICMRSGNWLLWKSVVIGLLAGVIGIPLYFMGPMGGAILAALLIGGVIPPIGKLIRPSSVPNSVSPTMTS
ncbi:MAG: hypothetical protein ACREJQ_05515 [bacterium]